MARDITELKRLEKEVLEISENERRRIGHDLHDGLGQELTGLAFLSQNIGRRLAEQSLPEAGELQRISGVINSAIEKTRDLAEGLSPVEDGVRTVYRLRYKTCRTGCGKSTACRANFTAGVRYGWSHIPRRCICIELLRKR